MSQQIDELLGKLTIQEKVSLLAGADAWNTVAIERLGIPALKVSDGPNGARGSDGNAGPTSAAFPVGIALGATWNVELISRVGKALAEEARSKGAHILLAPTVNIHRSPLAGRNFECFSEDPFLTSKLAVAYINGLQNEGVGACIKHFVCNESEFERFTMSSEVNERALHEIYLPPFKAAVEECHPWAVMSSYNKINGIWASENSDLLQTLLKGIWKYDGMVISDWYGTNSIQVVNGGLDLEMPGPGRWMGSNVLESVARGEILEETIDDKIRRLLATIVKARELKSGTSAEEVAVDDPEHRQLIREAGGEAIVLLKNQDDLLPIRPEKVKRIAIVGPNAKTARIMGGGSSRVAPHYAITPYDGICRRAGELVEIEYAIGSTNHKKPPLLDHDRLTTIDGRRRGLTAEYFNDQDLTGEAVFTQVIRSSVMSWFGDLPEVVDPAGFSVRLSGVYLAPETGVYQFSLESTGKSRLYVDGQIRLDFWKSQEQEMPLPANGQQRVARLAMTGEQTYQISAEFSFGEDARWRAARLGALPPVPDDPIADAAALARRSDMVIVFAGLSDEWDSEGFDRPDMDLPGDQCELIQELARANPSTVVVLNSGSAVTMPWLNEVGAVIQAWYPGQEAGNAMADILFGDVNPSGKLPQTFPRHLRDNPTYVNYPGENGKVYYGEGLFIGYRYYDKKQIAPLFPFGHGLSYTDFEYADLKTDREEYRLGDKIQVSVDITNAGKREGKEVVQLYLRDVESTLVRPEKELKGFAKVTLLPGETQTVRFALEHNCLAFYDPSKGSWRTEAGEFELLIGRSAADIRLSKHIMVYADRDSSVGQPRHLHVGLKLETLLQDKDAAAILEKHLAQLMNHPQAAMAMSLTLKQIASFAPDQLTPELLEAIDSDLSAIR